MAHVPCTEAWATAYPCSIRASDWSNIMSNNADEYDVQYEAEQAEQRAFYRGVLDGTEPLDGEGALTVVSILEWLSVPEDGSELRAAFKVLKEKMPVLLDRLYNNEGDQS